MAEGNNPKFVVPTTPKELGIPSDVWSEFFGDSEEQQYMLTDIRERHVAGINQDGENFLWMKRRLSGDQCSFWDEQAGQCRDPLNEDEACYNTKYVGGYHAPMEIKVALPGNAKQIVQQDAGLLKTQPMKAWTLWTPTLTDRDMLIRPLTGERFEVLNVQESGPWRGLIIMQYFDIRPMQKGVDFAFDVHVPVDR